MHTVKLQIEDNIYTNVMFHNAPKNQDNFPKDLIS